MKITQLKISAARLSKAVLIAASLSCVGMTSNATASETILMNEQVASIVKTLETNLAQQISGDATLGFKPIELAVYEKTESGEIKLKTATTHNLGHQHELLKIRMANQLDKLNELQAAAMHRQTAISVDSSALQEDAVCAPTFVDLVADKAYGAFNSIYGLVDAESVEADAKKCAENTWLVRALTDYGIISEAYRSLYGAKESEHNETIKKEADQRKLELDKAKKAKEEDRAARNLEFDKEATLRKNKKAKIESNLNKEKDTIRQSSLIKIIADLDAELHKIETDRNTFNAQIEADIAQLTRDYEEAISQLNYDKAADLSQLEAQFAKVFELFGNSWGFKTYKRGWNWNRSMRSEFAIFDEMLSTKYTDLYPQARLAVLSALFSRVVDEDKSLQKQKRLTLKTLLSLDDTSFKETMRKVLKVEVDKERKEREQRLNNIEEAKKKLEAQNSLASTVMPKVLASATSASKTEPTKAESQLTTEFAEKFAEKKV
ncbi:hypothetical protein [Candidatus Odyssella thessalonicensis]|uniref:hypothetical protein n=1 Tax=Candidatus Odyssella thessalonicensis TaxID=84647 RepID=UPI000225B45A|nr:hypothetical protein [Candidatus Odyssella thessalonicensis]